jgi:hypothetical protein
VADQLLSSSLLVRLASDFGVPPVSWTIGCYGEKVVSFIVALVEGQKTIPDDELQAWAEEQASINAKRGHFFSTGRFGFSVSNLPDRQADVGS